MPQGAFDDVGVVDERDVAYCSDTALSLPFDRAELAEVAMSFDRLLGRRVLPASGYSLEALSRDGLRRSYPVMAATLARDTRLGRELVTLMRYLELSAAGKNVGPRGEALGMSRRKRKLDLPLGGEDSLMRLVRGFADWCPFEPAWHVAYRGAARSMRAEYPHNSWGRLLHAYMDPDAADDAPGDDERRDRSRVRGYARCMDMARGDGLAELRHRYGDGYGRGDRGRDRELRRRRDEASLRPVLTMEELEGGALPF